MTNNTITLAEAATKMTATQLLFSEIDFEAARFTAQEVDASINRLVKTGVDFHAVNEMLSAFYSAKQLEKDPSADVDGIGATHYEQLGEELLAELAQQTSSIEDELQILVAEQDSYLQSKFNLLQYGQYGRMLFDLV